MKIDIFDSTILFEKFSIEKYKNAIFIVDYQVDKFFHISQMIERNKVLVIKSGEKEKSTKGFYRIINFLIDNEISKKNQIVVVGGGTLIDLVGFVASVYKRGIPLHLVPTTLLSMADASIGGKNAINFQYIKNLLGTYYQPKSVMIDFTFLTTLPKKHVISGYIEILKVGMLKSKKFYEYLINNLDKLLINNKLYDIIKNSINYKLSIIKHDLYDNNKRKLLNFGHTIGHIIELKYNLPHGISVGYGIRFSLILSEKYLDLNNSITTNYENYLANFNFNFEKKFDIEKIIRNIKQDKKSLLNRIEIILLKDIGEPVIYKIEYEQFINDIKTLFKS